MSPAERRIRMQRACMAGAALLALAAGLIAISPAPVGVFWDDAVYLITAKALATGEGYRYIHLPGAPAATHYPPLWPALLSLVWRIAPDFPENVRLMKLLNPALLAAAAACTTLLATRVTHVRPWIAATTVASSIAVAPMLMISSVLMSEPLCLALSAAALASTTLMVMRGRPRDALWAGALVGLAVLARSSAIVLLPGLAVGLLWKRSRRAALIALGVSLVMVAPWFIWSGAYASEVSPSLAGSYGPYTSWIVDGYRNDPGMLAAIARKNLVSALVDARVGLFGGLPHSVRIYFTIPLLLMTAAGLALAGRRAAPLSVTLLAYTALVTIWPYPPGRFMWALFPLYAVAVIVAAIAIARRMRQARLPRRAALVPLGFAALFVVMMIRYDVRTIQRRWYATAIDQMADEVVGPIGWISRNTAPTDTLATDLHLLVYLYTNRIAVPLNTLTVAEHLVGKTVEQTRAEFAAIDSAFRPKWWIVSGIEPERTALVGWINDPGSTLRAVANLPGGGIAALVAGR